MAHLATTHVYPVSASALASKCIVAAGNTYIPLVSSNLRLLISVSDSLRSGGAVGSLGQLIKHM